MVERCHRSLESVIKKVIQKQEDWYPVLNSVLFSMCSQTHSSTGYSPIRMLYNKDPILPFEMADKLENGGGGILMSLKTAMKKNRMLQITVRE